MKIKFTLFNDGQEHYEFDTKTLKKGEKLEKFIISKDSNGRLEVMPMICYKKTTFYGAGFLEKL